MEYLNINQDSNKGLAALSGDVFKDIARLSVEKVEGAYPAKKDNDFVTCNIKDGNLKLTLSLRLKQGIDVNDVCTKLQKRVFDALLQMTGIECYDINLDIQGFVMDKK